MCSSFRTKSFFLCLIVNLCNPVVLGAEEEKNDLDKENSLSFEVLYSQGVQRYLENDFKGCIEKLTKAVTEYNNYVKSLQNCRLQCSEEALLSPPLYLADISDLKFFEKSIKNTLCLIKCRKKHPELLKPVELSSSVAVKLSDLKPYEYLHLCYFKEKEYQKAASAAFTYLVGNPNDSTAQLSLKHYLTLPDVKKNEIVNFEAKDYMYLYAHACDAYEKKEWIKSINYMEESLTSYIQSEEECRALCEGPYSHHGFYPDFIPAIANHFTVVLKCKTKCKNSLNYINSEFHDDLLPSHYDYLQYSYFKEGNYKAACEAVASYLLFYPDDKQMINNMKYYLDLPEVEEHSFTPRPEAVSYIQRQKYEEKIINFIKNEF